MRSVRRMFIAALMISMGPACANVFAPDLHVDGDLYVSGWAYVDYAVETAGVKADYDIYAFDELYGYSVTVGGDLDVWGKVESNGGYDPPYVLYDMLTRQELAKKVHMEVAPEKQSGAALFFNGQTKQLEIYVPSDGKFYNLLGKALHTLAKVELPTTEYETSYYLDPATGKVKTRQKAIHDRFHMRPGYKLDDKTGKFINERSGEQVSREEALVLHLAKDGNYYDLKGNLIGAKMPGPLADRAVAKQAQTQKRLEFASGSTKSQAAKKLCETAALADTK